MSKRKRYSPEYKRELVEFGPTFAVELLGCCRFHHPT
jgi:hypothetical protein